MQVNDANKNRVAALVVGLLCLFLQVGVAPNLGLGEGRMNLALVYAGCYALSVGGRKGVAAGFIAGLVYDLSTTGPIGLVAMLLTAMAYFLGAEERNRFADGLPQCLASFGISCLAVELAYHFVMLMMGQASSLGDAFVIRALPSFALTFVVFLPFGYYFAHDARTASHNKRVRRPRGGGHYSTKGL